MEKTKSYFGRTSIQTHHKYLQECFQAQYVLFLSRLHRGSKSLVVGVIFEMRLLKDDFMGRSLLFLIFSVKLYYMAAFLKDEDGEGILYNYIVSILLFQSIFTMHSLYLNKEPHLGQTT